MNTFRVVNSQEFHGNPMIGGTLGDPLIIKDQRTGLIIGRKSLDLDATGPGWRMSASVKPEPWQRGTRKEILLVALREVLAQVEATEER